VPLAEAAALMKIKDLHKFAGAAGLAIRLHYRKASSGSRFKGTSEEEIKMEKKSLIASRAVVKKAIIATAPSSVGSSVSKVAAKAPAKMAAKAPAKMAAKAPAKMAAKAPAKMAAKAPAKMAAKAPAKKVMD
jgi:hypothetical protein